MGNDRISTLDSTGDQTLGKIRVADRTIIANRVSRAPKPWQVEEQYPMCLYEVRKQ